METDAFDSQEAYEQLIVLDSNKSISPEQIHLKPVKCLADSYSPVLPGLFNTTLQKGIILTDWTTIQHLPNL